MSQRDPRDRLVLPVSAVILGVWMLSAVLGAVTGDFRFFEVASGPMLLMSGYVFGVRIVRNTVRRNGDD